MISQFCRKSSKPHEDIIGIRSQNRGSLAQGKNYLMSKFSSLNQKVKQTKSNVNMSNLKKLGNFTKPEMKVNFLKPNLKVNLWKSDSSLETMENPTDAKMHAESDIEISSDNDSFHSDDFLTNSKSDDDQQFVDSLENVGQVDYVLPSCGIIASAPWLGSRSQSISSTDLNISIPAPSDIDNAQCGDEAKRSETEGKLPQETHSTVSTAVEFTKPVDAYCHRFVQDAQIKMTNVSVMEIGSQDSHQEADCGNAFKKTELSLGRSSETLSRPSKLDVPFSGVGSQFLVVEQTNSSQSRNTLGSSSSTLEVEPGLHMTPSPAENNGSRAVSPFAKIRSSMVQVANITQAGLTQGINFAVAKVQKSPAEPESINEFQQNELREMFTQCQTRIIQI